MQIIPLSEGAFTIDNTKQFVPFNLNEDDLQSRPTGSLLVEIQPFIVITSKDILLLDTGLGFLNKEGALQIYQNLLNNNIAPEHVTKVLLTHLHKDHSGGISKDDNLSGQKLLSFPNATYYVNKQELEFALKKGNPSYIPEEFEILNHSKNIHLIEGNGVIDEYIYYEVTGAHSPFHQVFRIIENDQKIFFGGDDAPQLLQMKSRFIAKYDFNGKKCMELRKQWWQQGEEERWTFLFYHDIKTPVYKF